jgi:parallel beta-helix repeat protein
MNRILEGREKMKNRLVVILMVLTIMASMLMIAVSITPSSASPDELHVPVDYTTIQAAINAASPGDTIVVDPGEYDEQVIINKSLTIQGMGNDTIIKPSSAANLTQVFDGLFWYGMPNTKQIAGIIVANVSDGSNVTIKNLKVDESSVTTKPGGADYLTGIFYRETGGTIDTVNIVGTGAWSGGDRAYGIYLSAGTNAVSVQVNGSTITNYDKNGIEAMGDKLTFDIHDNVLTGRGPTLEGDEVQNGINVGRGSVGTVNNNMISNMSYAPLTWWSTGILFFGGGNGCSANSNIVVNCQIGIGFNDMNGSATDNIVSGGAVGKAGMFLQQYYATGTWAASFVNNILSGFDTEGIGAHSYDADTSLAVNIQGNQLTDGTGDGIYIGDIPEYGPAGSITAIISNNLISNWRHGIHLVSSVNSGSTITGNTITNNNGSGSGIHVATAVNAANIRVNYNNIMENIDHGAFNNGTNTLDARFNWWGNGTGPYHPITNPSGTGDVVSNNVDYKLWLIKPYPPAVPAPELYVDSVNIESPSYGKNFTTDVKLVNVTDLYGFEFKLYWNTTLLDLVEADVTPPWANYSIGINQINETIGRYYVGLSALAQSPSFNGSTTLVTLTFKITYVPTYPQNVSCPFDLSETVLGDPDGKSIPHIVYDGEYRCCAVKAKIQVLPQVNEAKALSQVFNISITVTNVANLYTFEFTLQYNTTLLDAKEIAIASFPGRTYKVSKKIIDDTQGLVTLRIESISPPLQANETLVLASITFQVTHAVIWPKPAIESYLRFNSTKLITDAPVDVPHDKTDGLYRYRPIQGDMDSDGKVTIIDLAIVAKAYGTKPGDPKWNELADLNHDNIINILDLIPVARNYGRTD